MRDLTHKLGPSIPHELAEDVTLPPRRVGSHWLLGAFLSDLQVVFNDLVHAERPGSEYLPTGDQLPPENRAFLLKGNDQIICAQSDRSPFAIGIVEPKVPVA